ncbi:magnesium transporter NIPA-domain-containing protein [Phycomyces nitens]|nr:magnesium transporter NIPA-domain-containing protein [Phycomyces nitens]
MGTPEPAESDIAYNAFIGVLVSVCGNALISVALNVQKLAHNKIQEHQMANYFANMDEPPRWIATSQSAYAGGEFFPDDGYSSPRTSEDVSRTEEEEAEHRKLIIAMAQEQTKSGESDYLKSKLWWLGISLMVLGEVGNFVAYGFAPASTIAPLGTTTLVANVILAPLMLKEAFRGRDFLGVIFAVVGAATVVFSSNSEETAFLPDMIVEALTQTRSLVYFSLTGAAIMALTILSPLYGTKSIMIDLGLVAIYGGYTVLCTKSVSSLLSLSFLTMFTYPVSYILIITLVVTAVLQIKYLNKALQRFESTQVIPTQFVLFTISAIIGSAVLYHDFDGMSMDQTSRFMTGCAIEFLGVYFITSKRDKRPPELSLQNDGTAGFNNPVPSQSGSVSQTIPEDHTVSILRDPQNDIFPRRTAQQAQNRLSGLPINAARASVSFRTPIMPMSPEDRQTTAAAAARGHRRRSSMFRGISLTSQLVDRMNEETTSNAAIQLPSSPTRQNFGFAAGHRRGDSTLSTILTGLGNIAHDALPGHYNHHHQQQHQNDFDADAIEIEIPTASSITSPRPSSDGRELLPLFIKRDDGPGGSKRNSARLLEIEESAEYRDLS